jgi:DNA-binding GntR family transcriptional regulator
MSPSSAQGLEGLHARLRDMILSGALAPGTPISQVSLSREMGVSRTPLREVLRMLQQEGLVVAELNRRVRVAEVNFRDLEYLYTQRVLSESLGVAYTVQRGTPKHFDQIEASLVEMEDLTDSPDPEKWNVAHEAFHRALVAGAPQPHHDAILALQERSRSYRRLYARVVDEVATRRPVSMLEHQSIVEACREREPVEAGERLAKHLGRTALTLMTHLAPQQEPALLRLGLQLVVRGDLRLSALTHLPEFQSARETDR